MSYGLWAKAILAAFYALFLGAVWWAYRRDRLGKSDVFLSAFIVFVLTFAAYVAVLYA